MAEYIRQSLHVATLAALTNSVGVRPGFIAMVDAQPGRRYTAVLAGTFDIDGDHVVAGQDGTQWTDDANGDLAGSFARPMVVGIEGAQLKGNSYTTDAIPFGNNTQSIVSDGYNLWICHAGYQVVYKIDPNNWEAPLATISLQEDPNYLFLIGDYIACTSDTRVTIIDWHTNEIVGFVSTSNYSVTVCLDNLNTLWTSSSVGVEYFSLSNILLAYPASGSGTSVVLPNGSAACCAFGNGFVWATHYSNTLTRINPSNAAVTVYTLSAWVNNAIPVCTDGYIWTSTLDTDVLRYDANNPGTDPFQITLPSSYVWWMTEANGILYVADNDFGVDKVHSIDVATGTYLNSVAGLSESDWLYQLAVLGPNVWVSMTEVNYGYSSTPLSLTGSFGTVYTEFPSVTVSGVDLNKNPFPAVVKTGDIIAAVPGSGSPSKVIPIDASTFFTLRQASVVLTNTVLAHGDYTSTPIALNNAGGTLDLNFVHTIDAAYDGYRYLWVIGYDDEGATPVYYTWKVDSTLVEPVLATVFELSDITVLALACAGNFVIASIQETGGTYRFIKLDNAGVIVDSTVADTSYGTSGFMPVSKVATNNAHFAWFGGRYDTDIDGTQPLTVRVNPSLTVHKTDDVINVITAPISTDITSVNALLNDLKSKINAHLVQSGVHLLSDDVNTILTPNATDVTSPYTTATALANSIRNWFGSHTSQFLNFASQGFQQSGTHYYLDNTNRIAVSAVTNSTDLASIILLANDIRSVYEGHRTQLCRLIHHKFNSTNSPFWSLAGPSLYVSSGITTFDSAQIAFNAIKPLYNLHLEYPGVHDTNDTVNAVIAADATDPDPSWPTAASLANDIKAMFNAHLLEVGLHVVTAGYNYVSTPDAVATNPLSVITLANALASDTTLGEYNRHRTAASTEFISTGEFSTTAAWDGSGHMYITNLWEPSISRISIADGYVTNISIAENPTAVAWDGGGYMYVCCNAGQIHIISVATGLIVNSTVDLGINCQGIAWDGDSAMWVANPDDGIITIISTATQTPVTTIPIGDNPKRIVWDHGSPGHMYIINDGQYVDLNIATRVSVATGLVVGDPIVLSDWPRDGAWGGDGYVYINAGYVYKIDADTGLINNFISVGSPEGIAWDGDGYMWVTDSNTGHIRRIRQSDFSYSLADVIPTPLGQLWDGIAWDGDGYMYVADFSASAQAIRIYIATGEIATTFVHKVNDTVNIEALPAIPARINAGTLVDVQLLLNDLVTQYTAHIASTTYHLVEDTVNGITAPAATDTAPSAPTAYALAIDLKTSFNNHLIETDVHIWNDAASTILGPDPTDDTDISGILDIANAFADGYFAIHPYAGAYNFHVLQNCEFVYTDPYDNGTVAALALSPIDNQTLVLIGIEGVIVPGISFEVMLGQVGQVGESTTPPGTRQFNWTTTGLPVPPTALRGMAVDTANNRFWFLVGGVPDEITNPYTVYRVPSLFYGPDPVVDLSTQIAFNLAPSCISSSGISPIRISYQAADYIGNISSEGVLDTITKYPMGGAVTFTTIEPLQWLTSNNFSYPVVEVVPNEILPGAGISISTAGAGKQIVISTPSVVAVSLANVQLGGGISFTPEQFDGVTLTIGDKILACRQTDPLENGIYVYWNSPGWFLRSVDTVYCGSKVYVEQGDVFGGRVFQQQTLGTITAADQATIPQIWQSDIGPHLAPPLTYTASGGTLWTTLDTVPAISGSTDYGWDLIVVTDSVCTNASTSAVIGRERGTVTYRRAKSSSTLTLSDDSRILTAPTVFQQVISSGTVLLQANRQASNCYFRIRCWYEQVKSNL